MKSNIAVTYEVDDTEVAVNELYEKIFNGFTLEKNSVGILFCYSDSDLEPMLEAINNKFPFEVIGCTTIASLDQRDGFHEMAVTFLVLTANDCNFSTALSQPITPTNITRQIKASYDQALDRLPEDPKLIFALPPYLLEIMLDQYTITFNEIAQGIPVIGGLPSYNGNGDTNRVFYHGKAYEDRMALLVVSGNIRPVFSVQNSGSVPLDRKRKVTSARENIIYEAGGQKFTDYMAELGFMVEDLANSNGTVSLVSYPILVEYPKDGQVYRFLRSLHSIDLKEGSGTAIGQIPEGSIISVCPLLSEDIAKVAKVGVKDLNQRMDQTGAGYSYSTVLAISCIGRYVILLPEGNLEVDQVRKGLRKGLTLGGFYSYGEIGPYQNEAATLSFAHNESMVLCAF